MNIPFKYIFKSLFQRRASTSMTIGAFALVVLVLIALLAMVEGVNRTLISAGSPDRMFVIDQNATNENQSRISAADVRAVELYGEVKTDAQAQPYASEEVVKTSYLELPGEERLQINFRGLDPGPAQKVHYQMQLMDGRFFDPDAINEVMLGKSIYESTQLDVGERFIANQVVWTVVGVFSDNGSPFESEIWTSRNNMAIGFDRTSVSSVWMVVRNPSQIEDFVEQINEDPTLFLYATTESDYFAQGTQAAQSFQLLTWFIALVMSIGAIFSAMNTMYASVADRTGELGMMRAIGFQARSVRLATQIEALLMALIGGLLACAIAFLFQGMTFRTPLTGLGYVTFRLTLTPFVFVTGLLFSLVMGTVGGWIPARHSVQIPIVEAINNG